MGTPQLSAMGAYSSQHTYSPSDVRSIVTYARYRGVRVIPEFDSPSHTMPSWGKGGPAELLTTCGNSLGPLRPDRGQVRVSYGTFCCSWFIGFSSHLLCTMPHDVNASTDVFFPVDAFARGGAGFSRRYLSCWCALPSLLRQRKLAYGPDLTLIWVPQVVTKSLSIAGMQTQM